MSDPQTKVERSSAYEVFSEKTHAFDLSEDIAREVSIANDKGFYLSGFRKMPNFPVFEMTFTNDTDRTFETRVVEVGEFYSLTELNDYSREVPVTSPRWAEVYVTALENPYLRVVME